MRTLISHRFAFSDAAAAYELLASDGEAYVGIMLEYGERSGSETTPGLRLAPDRAAGSLARKGAVRVAFIGAGNYGGRVLIPAFKRAGASLQAVASSGGVSAAYYGRKHGFIEATTDARTAMASDAVDAVVIATRHDSHAALAEAALRAGKHVFVEKPLAVTVAEVANLEAAVRGAPGSPALMVGFNRRFAPHVVRMKSLLGAVNEPKSVVITVNAGAVPQEHWIHDPQAGGGRIIAEGCHFIDLARFLAGSPIVEARATSGTGPPAVRDSDVTVVLRFADGSTAVIHYLVHGHRSYPKERVEVFCAGRVLRLDNFRVLRGFGWRGFSRMGLWTQDKGQVACAVAFLESIRAGKPSPIPLEELFEVARITIAVGNEA